MIAREVGDRAGGDDELAERRARSRPASLSTGISTPSEVADSAIATSSGVSTSPPASSAPADSERDREREREAEPGEPQDAAAQPGEVDLEPGQEEQEGEADGAR